LIRGIGPAGHAATTNIEDTAMSDEIQKPVCPQFHSAFIGWYAVQGYCAPRGSSDRPMIPNIAEFESRCTSSRFQECPRFLGMQHLIGGACLGAARNDRP
jgi:hypothetical protein